MEAASECRESNLSLGPSGIARVSDASDPYEYTGKGDPFFVVSCPEDFYSPGVWFSRLEFLTTLMRKSWPDGMIVRDNRDGQEYKVEGDILIATSDGQRQRATKPGSTGLPRLVEVRE
jgi:hypothetical protein